MGMINREQIDKIEELLKNGKKLQLEYNKKENSIKVLICTRKLLSDI